MEELRAAADYNAGAGGRRTEAGSKPGVGRWVGCWGRVVVVSVTAREQSVGLVGHRYRGLDHVGHRPRGSWRTGQQGG